MSSVLLEQALTKQMRHVNENIIFIIMRQQCWAVFRVKYSQAIFTQEMLTWLRYVGSGDSGVYLASVCDNSGVLWFVVEYICCLIGQ